MSPVQSRSSQPRPILLDEATRRVQFLVEGLLDAAQEERRPEEKLGRARGLILAEIARNPGSGIFDRPTIETAQLYYKIGDHQTATDLLKTIAIPSIQIDGWRHIYRSHPEVLSEMVAVAESYRTSDPLLCDALLAEVSEIAIGQERDEDALAVERLR